MMNRTKNSNIYNRNQGSILTFIFLLFVILSLYYYFKLQEIYSNINSNNNSNNKPELIRKKAFTIQDQVDSLKINQHDIIPIGNLENLNNIVLTQNNIHSKPIKNEDVVNQIVIDNKISGSKPIKNIDVVNQIVIDNKISGSASTSISNSINAADLTTLEEIKLFNILKSNIDNAKEDNIPTLVKSFRRGKIDWHDLVQSLPETNNADYNWDRLVQSEIDVTKILTWNKKGYKPNHGPLTSFSMCGIIKDKCMIHTKGDCLRNSFCGWCESVKLCIDRSNPNQSNSLRPLCPEVLQFNKQNSCDGSINMFDKAHQHFVMEKNSQNCAYVINEPYFEPKPDSDAQSMYYHWFTNFYDGFISTIHNNKNIRTRDLHVLTSLKSNQFLQFFGLASRFCTRDIRFEVPDKTCFCHRDTNNEPVNVPSDAIVKVETPNIPKIKIPYVTSPIAPRDYITANDGQRPQTHTFIINSLGLDTDSDITFDSKKDISLHPRICFISRSKKRFILNEHELAAIAAKEGIIVDRLFLEEMSLYDQVRSIRHCAMLIGVHGSGIVNFMYMRSHTIVMQIMPLNILPFEGDFLKKYSVFADAEWHQWENKKLENAVFHWHFADQKTKDVRDKPASLLSQLQSQKNEKSLFFTFWLNQDTILPVEVFKDWITLIKSKFNYEPSDNIKKKLQALNLQNTI